MIDLKKEKCLIDYFLHSGNTERAAKVIEEMTGVTIFQIETVNPYPQNYTETSTRQKRKKVKMPGRSFLNI